MARPLPTAFAGPAESPGFLLWQISNAWQREQRAALQPYGLTHSQFVLLAVATWFGASEPLTQSRLSELSGVDVMTTSQIIRALERSRLLARKDHPDDPRAYAITVTAAGQKKARAALRVVEKTDSEFFEPLADAVDRLVDLFKTLSKPRGS